MSDNTFPKMTDVQIFDHYRRYTELFHHPKWGNMAIMIELRAKGYGYITNAAQYTFQWQCPPLPTEFVVRHLIINESLPHRFAPPVSRAKRVLYKVATTARTAFWSGFWVFWLTLCVVMFGAVQTQLTKNFHKEKTQTERIKR